MRPYSHCVIATESKVAFSATLPKNPQYRCSGGCVTQLQAEACKAKALKISCIFSCYHAALNPVEPGLRNPIAWLPHDVAVHREFSIQGHPKSICRSGGTASPPDLLYSNPSTRNLLAVKPPAFHQLPDRLVDTDKSTIRVTILSRTASGATS